MQNENVISKRYPYRWSTSVALCLIVFGVSCTGVRSAEQAETPEMAKTLDPAVNAESHFRLKDLAARHGTTLARSDRNGAASIKLNDYLGNNPNLSFGGAPLFNLYGEMIAVNSHGQSGEAEHTPAGSNFQEPVEVENVFFKRSLGMAVRAITLEEAKYFHLELGKILVINWLDPSGPVASSGVEVNDLLLEINGRPISSLDHLRHVVNRIGPKRRVIMFVLDHRTGRKGYVQVHTR
jgi:hypothetical protein